MSRRSALILNMALKQADCEFGNHAKAVPSNSTEMDNVVTGTDVQQQPSREMIDGKASQNNSGVDNNFDVDSQQPSSSRIMCLTTPDSNFTISTDDLEDGENELLNFEDSGSEYDPEEVDESESKKSDSVDSEEQELEEPEEEERNEQKGRPKKGRPIKYQGQTFKSRKKLKDANRKHYTVKGKLVEKK
ncbi:uncharacterized protein LOC126747196 [Anthonomus grandis grandis]|uniref:uncharacterized protein LOC126747196 n=1 Tax=Anthonomus grandis grandis TaxID=2921223 RepID=UPI0021668401|nr:uncharacterized protein LOC126747196 [Anthonomus grandis grandis]